MSLDIDMSFAGYWYDWLGIENENRFGLTEDLGPPTIEGVSLRWSNQHLSDEPPWLENPPDIYGWFSQPWMLIYRKFSDMFPMIFRWFSHRNGHDSEFSARHQVPSESSSEKELGRCSAVQKSIHVAWISSFSIKLSPSLTIKIWVYDGLRVVFSTPQGGSNPNP